MSSFRNSDSKIKKLLEIVKTMAMGRPLPKQRLKFDKVQWEREYIRACEQDQLHWQWGKPEDQIDTER
jgi:hypothetical protein